MLLSGVIPKGIVFYHRRRKFYVHLSEQMQLFRVKKFWICMLCEGKLKYISVAVRQSLLLTSIRLEMKMEVNGSS